MLGNRYREIQNIKESAFTKKANEFIQNKKKIKKKQYIYSYNLWSQLLKTSSMIMTNIDDLLSVSHYYLKPLIEDYINFCNFQYYGEDYTRAMQIHFLSEDIQSFKRRSGSEFEFAVSDFGVSNGNDLYDMQRTRDKHYYNIDDIDVKEALKHPANNSPSYFLSISSRINLYSQHTFTINNENNGHTEYIREFYALANNYGHLNLRFFKKSTQDSAKFTENLLEFIDDILSVTTEAILNRFGQWALMNEFLNLTKSLDNNDFAFLLNEDEDEADEDFVDDIYRIVLNPNYRISEKTGESEFQVISVRGYDDDENINDLTDKIDKEYIYKTIEDVLRDLNLDLRTEYEFENSI